jgi:hypothetical protein
MHVQSKKEELLTSIAELEAQYAQLRAEVLMMWDCHISITRALPPDLLRVSFATAIPPRATSGRKMRKM